MYETKQDSGAGAVVSFFKCRMRIKTNAFGSGHYGNGTEENAARAHIAERACLTVDELKKYADGKDIYGLEVSTPVRFPRPPAFGFWLNESSAKLTVLK